MAVDPRIAMGFQAPQIASPMDLAQNAFALKGAMQQNALAEAKMSEMQRQQQSQNALRQLFAGGKMPDAAAVYAIDPELGGSFAKNQAEIGRATAAAAASEAERAGSQYKNESAKFGDLLNLLSGARKDPRLYKINIALAKQRGFDVSQVPPEYDENWVNAAEQAVLTVKDRFDIEDRAEQRGISRGQLTVAQRNAAVNEAGEARAQAAYESSIDPETQRRLAEAKKRGEEAAGKGPAATSAAAAQAFLTSAGYDPETGADAVSKLIPKSTGGLLQTAGAMAAGALNITTSGQEAIGQLASRSSKLVLDLLGGKLGAGVSNADREFMLQAVGDIGNSLLPTGVRLAAWNDLMSRMKTAAGGGAATTGAPSAPAAAGSRKTKSGVTYTVEE